MLYELNMGDVTFNPVKSKLSYAQDIFLKITLTIPFNVPTTRLIMRILYVNSSFLHHWAFISSKFKQSSLLNKETIGPKMFHIPCMVIILAVL